MSRRSLSYPASPSFIPFVGGGTDFASMTWNRTDADTTTHKANTWFDVAGSGFVVMVFSPANGETSAIQIDGGSILTWAWNFQDGSAFIFERFESACKISSDTAASATYSAWLLTD